jgi:hypothetical protein
MSKCEQRLQSCSESGTDIAPPTEHIRRSILNHTIDGPFPRDSMNLASLKFSSSIFFFLFGCLFSHKNRYSFQHTQLILHLSDKTTNNIMSMYSPEENYMTEYNNNSPNSYQEYDTNDNYQAQPSSTTATDPGYMPPPTTQVDGPPPAEESPFARKTRRRRRRRVRMAAAGTTGLVVGIILFSGPFVVVAVAGGGIVAARALSKRAERKKDQRVARLSPVVVN